MSSTRCRAIRLLSTIVMTLVLLALHSAAPAATIRVDPGGGGYPTIQQGIDAALDGDRVVIAPGTYTGAENRALTFTGKNLTIEAESGFGTVTIDCESADRAFNFAYTGQDTTTAIRNLVIRNGSTTNFNGGAVICSAVGLVIENCLFESCVASHNGGALSVGYNSGTDGVRVRNCVFKDNLATYRGGAVIVDHATAYIRTCLFTGNSTTATGGSSNGGGAVYLNWIDNSPDLRCTVSRCTFASNSSAENGSALYGWNSVIWTFVDRCIFAFNDGPGLGVYSSPLIDGLTFSIAYGNEGGNIAAGYSTVIEEDPLFCGMAGGDYTLCSNSPALPGGNIYGMLIGFADLGCGECDSAVQERSWGVIKSLYRE